MAGKASCYSMLRVFVAKTVAISMRIRRFQIGDSSTLDTEDTEGTVLPEIPCFGK
jgi:hypothetical protein